MYQRDPKAEELAAWGFTLDDVRGPPVDIWPEHVDAFRVFVRMGTQWRTSMSGVTGLDYNVLLRLMDRMGLDEALYDQMLDDVRVMESEALSVIREGQ